jgi:hypothetical protein
MTPKDPLEVLRAAGVAKQNEADRQKSTEEHERDRQVLEYGKRATSMLGALAHPMWRVGIGALALFTVVIGSVMVFVKPQTHGKVLYDPENWPAAVGLAGAVVVMLCFHVMAALLVRAAVDRENQWLASLPFPIHNHFMQFSGRQSRCKVQFDGDGPGSQMMNELSAGIRVAEVSVRNDKNPFELRVEFPHDSTDHSHWAGWHALVETLLMPIHARWRIVSVTVSR